MVRLLDYYTQRARAADWDEERASTWLETEAANLHAAARFAGEHGLHEYAIAIPAAMSSFLYGTSRWQQGKELTLIAAAAAERTGNRLAHAGALAELGRFRHMTGDTPPLTVT